MKPGTTWARRAVPLLIIFCAQSAAAHIPQLRGRLIDLVGQSDLVVVGTVDSVSAVDTRLKSTTVRVEGNLVGAAPERRLTFRGRARFAPGRRFVFFLRRSGAGFECVQPSGTQFPSRPEDDAAYRDAVTAIQRALAVPVADRASALRAAMIPALSAGAARLRYYAVLELASLAHHGLTEPERRALEQLAADPESDPAVRLLVKDLAGAGASQRR
jgi:hypothetical protein